MVGAVFPPCYLTWGQRMAEVMKIKVTSFKRSHACTAAHSIPNPAAGHCWPMFLPEIPEHSGQVWVSFWWDHWSCLLGLGTHKVLFMPSKSLFPVLCKFWQLYGGANGDLLQEGLWRPGLPSSAAPRAPAAVHSWPVPLQETLKYSSVSISVGSLGPGAYKVCLSPLSISGGYGVWS